MRFKADVDPKYLASPMWYALWLADELHQEEAGRPATCTSTGESKHHALRSRHYPGEWGYGYSHAFDLRTWHIEAEAFAIKLRERLGGDYVVLVEDDHIHVHWGPVFHEA